MSRKTANRSSAGRFISRTAGHYRADFWRDAGCRCEIWAESRSITSVTKVAETAERVYLVRVARRAFAAQRHDRGEVA